MRRRERKEERGIAKLRVGEGRGRDEGGRRWQTAERKTNVRPMETIAELGCVEALAMREDIKDCPPSNGAIGWLAGGLTAKPEERGNCAAIRKSTPIPHLLIPADSSTQP